MRYFIDFEFIEGFHKPLFGKKRHFIDMISVGIYCEDGRSYHALSSEYRYKDASDWVKDNIIIPIYRQGVHGDARNVHTAESFHKWFGKPNKKIAEEIYLFCLEGEKRQPMGIGNPYEPVVEFYGYYANYDWVLFCSLYGRMIDLPAGYPMYCRDLKQMLDECYGYQENKYPDEIRLESWLKFVKAHPEYPKNTQEHNALADAKWNYDLYQFITQKKFLNKEYSQAMNTIPIKAQTP
jgi:hypothetical protein